MALTPYTRQEEWYQQMINASTGNYLPSITAQDEGKVLTVENDGSWGVENVPSELPPVGSSDKDKYLHTNASTGDVEWSAAPTELPSVSGTDEGKVLTVNNSGEWVAANPASGGGVLVVTGTVSDDTVTLNKTWQQIHDADAVVVCVTSDEGKAFYTIFLVGTRENLISGDTEYIVGTYYPGSASTVFEASSSSGYPSYTFE